MKSSKLTTIVINLFYLKLIAVLQLVLLLMVKNCCETINDIFYIVSCLNLFTLLIYILYLINRSTKNILYQLNRFKIISYIISFLFFISLILFININKNCIDTNPKNIYNYNLNCTHAKSNCEEKCIHKKDTILIKCNHKDFTTTNNKNYYINRYFTQKNSDSLKIIFDSINKQILIQNNILSKIDSLKNSKSTNVYNEIKINKLKNKSDIRLVGCITIDTFNFSINNLPLINKEAQSNYKINETNDKLNYKIVKFKNKVKD